MSNNNPQRRTGIIRPVNNSVLIQHLEEAAFYWTRHEAGIWSPAYDKIDLATMDELLDAHLRGLSHAGSAVVTRAIENLNRWKSADEAFVSTYVMTLVPDNENLEAVETLIDQMPTLICGAAAALHWAGFENNHRLVQRWSNSNSLSLRRAAFPALIAASNEKAAVAIAGVADPSPTVRARALRAVGQWRIKDCLSVAKDAIADSCPECRFEAIASAYILGQKLDASIALEAMNELDQQQAPDDPIAKQFSESAKRRRLMFWASMCEEQKFTTWIDSALGDPQRCRDAIWSLAFRGEPLALDYFEKLLREDRQITLVAYALSHVTGLDLETAGFYTATEDEPEKADDDELVEAEMDDDGLLEPDVGKLLAWLENYKTTSLLKQDQRYLGGQSIAQSAQEILENGTQPQRWQSALYLSRIEGQAGCLAALRAPTI